MASSSSLYILKALVVFKSEFNPELIRTVHLYGNVNGVEEITEREYIFSEADEYTEMRSPNKVFTLQRFNVSAHFPTLSNGIWVCILVFDIYQISRFNLGSIPNILNISRNPKLAAIPTLVRDLEAMVQMVHGFAHGVSSQSRILGSMQAPRERPRLPHRFDLNLLPDSDSDES